MIGAGGLLAAGLLTGCASTEGHASAAPTTRAASTHAAPSHSSTPESLPTVAAIGNTAEAQALPQNILKAANGLLTLERAKLQVEEDHNSGQYKASVSFKLTDGFTVLETFRDQNADMSPASLTDVYVQIDNSKTGQTDAVDVGDVATQNYLNVFTGMHVGGPNSVDDYTAGVDNFVGFVDGKEQPLCNYDVSVDAQTTCNTPAPGEQAHDAAVVEDYACGLLQFAEGNTQQPPAENLTVAVQSSTELVPNYGGD